MKTHKTNTSITRKGEKSPTKGKPASAPGAPDVIVDFIFEQGLLFIAIRNIGSKPAYQVRVTFDKDIRGIENTKSISELPLFQQLEFLAPQREIRTFLDHSASYFGSGQPQQIMVDVRFMDSFRRKFKAAIPHNLAIYKELGYIKTSLDG